MRFAPMRFASMRFAPMRFAPHALRLMRFGSTFYTSKKACNEWFVAGFLVYALLWGLTSR